jgi:hypothetical protein
MNENDHDLLIQIATKLDRAILDIKELKDNTTARVSALEEEKLNQRDFDTYKQEADARDSDKEKRLRRLERWGFMVVGVIGAVEIAIGIYQIFHQ